MRKQLDCEFAESAGAEAPLVIAYMAALTLFAFAWSNSSLPPTGIMELQPAAIAKSTEKRESLVQQARAKSLTCRWKQMAGGGLPSVC
jgi:hypothetical protein